MVSFLVENFVLCFGASNEYLLGEEADIVLDGNVMEDDSDSGTDVGVGDTGGTDGWDSLDQVLYLIICTGKNWMNIS